MMKDSTKPKSASASVNAMPRNIVVRTVPAASGWRAIAVMAFPTTSPMPMPGPMAAPPYTMPRPTAVRPDWSSPAPCAAKTTGSSKGTSLVLGVHGQADVHARQDREDEGLEGGDKDLERGQRDEQRERERRADLEVDGRAPDRRAEDREGREDEVTGEHVGEEPDGQREGPYEEGRDELDEDQQRQDDDRDPGRDDRALEEAEESLPLDPDDVEDEPDEQGQEQWDGDTRVPRELHERDDLEDVDEEDEEEHRDEKGQVTHPVGTDRLEDDALPHEVDARLGETLHPRGHELTSPPGDEEEKERDQHRRDEDEDRLVDRERRVGEPDVGPTGDVGDRGEVDPENHGAASFRALTGVGRSRCSPGEASEKLTERSSQNRSPRWVTNSVKARTTTSTHPNSARAARITTRIDTIRRRKPPSATAKSGLPPRRAPHSSMAAEAKKFRTRTPRPRAALAAPSTPRARPATRTIAGATISPRRTRSVAIRRSTGGAGSTACPPLPSASWPNRRTSCGGTRPRTRTQPAPRGTPGRCPVGRRATSRRPRTGSGSPRTRTPAPAPRRTHGSWPVARPRAPCDAPQPPVVPSRPLAPLAVSL